MYIAFLTVPALLSCSIYSKVRPAVHACFLRPLLNALSGRFHVAVPKKPRIFEFRSTDQKRRLRSDPPLRVYTQSAKSKLEDFTEEFVALGDSAFVSIEGLS